MTFVEMGKFITNNALLFERMAIETARNKTY